MFQLSAVLNLTAAAEGMPGELPTTFLMLVADDSRQPQFASPSHSLPSTIHEAGVLAG
jgi:hypothetical protein